MENCHFINHVMVSVLEEKVNGIDTHLESIISVVSILLVLYCPSLLFSFHLIIDTTCGTLLVPYINTLECGVRTADAYIMVKVYINSL